MDDIEAAYRPHYERYSMAEWLARMEPPQRLAWLERIGPELLAAFETKWENWARPDQRTPEGDWAVWLVLAGRGFGKTRMGAEWVRAQARCMGQRRIALVAATMAEARAVMVEGESGLLAISPGRERPDYEPSLGRLRWRSGTQAFLHSAAEPDSLRGPQFDMAWADEIAKWARGEETWANLQFAMRLGEKPQLVATTTPRPVSLVRRLVGEATKQGSVVLSKEKDRASTGSARTDVSGGEALPIVVTRGTTHANAAHLAPDFIAAIEANYGGTRLGRQEIGGELIEDIEGSLWPRALIEACRVAAILPGMGRGTVEDGGGGATTGATLEASPLRLSDPLRVAHGLPPPRAGEDLRRIVIGVDPPASSGGDACGIVVAGLGGDGRGYVLEDASVEGMRPEGWARAVAGAAARWDADRVVAEANQGGDMVRSVLEAVETRLPLRLVHASRGKVARAEPVAALYEKDRVRHAGRFAALEDEMAGMVIGGGYAGPGRSPDRADALVWALTELMLGKRGKPGVRGL